MELLDADNDAQGDHGDEQEDATSSSSKKKIRLKSVVCLFVCSVQCVYN